MIGSSWFDDLSQDARFATRSLRRRPAFTFVAALTLALGIGATTALFGVVKAVLLEPLPYRDPAGVTQLWSSWKGFERTWLSYDEFELFETEIPAFANVALWSDGAVNLTGGDQPERVRSAAVTMDVFDVLGVPPMIGRSFTAEEDRPDGPRAAILSHEIWQRRFGADPAVVGRDVQVNGENIPIVGVMPAGFRLPLDYGANGPTGIWLPLATNAEQTGGIPGPASQPNGGSHGYYGVARLRPGATAAQAGAQLDAMVRRLEQDGTYNAERQYRALAVPVEEQVTGRLRTALLITFGAVGFVLLIACANVAGLLLVRGESRRRELAVRVALGADGGRISRQLLTETVVLAALGGGLGIVLAAGAVQLLRATAPAALPRVAETTLDPVVLSFAVLLAFVAALLAGLLPALQATRVAPAAELKEGGRGATVGAARLRWRQALVVVEVALAVVLVVGAGLMVRTVRNLFSIDPGFNPEGVLTLRVSTPSVWYQDSAKVAAFHEELRRRVRAIPGVQDAGAARILPLATEMGDWGLQVEGYTPPPNTGTPADWQVVTAGYFQAMGLNLNAGRFLDERDRMDAPLAMVVNRRFVELYLQGREPLGTLVRLGSNPARPRFTIVGVVDNVHHDDLVREVKAQFYVPMPQFAANVGNTTRSMSLVVRMACAGGCDPTSLVSPVRAAIRAIDPRLPVAEVRTMDEIVGQSLAAPRFAMELLGLFGVLALVLSAVGIFGIVSQLVASRAQEFGIRAALGASPRQLVLLGLSGGVRQAAVGVALGAVAALALSRAMTGILHGVAPTDPLTFLTVIVVTLVVAIAATLPPARRAGRADPMAVLHDAG